MSVQRKINDLNLEETIEPSVAPTHPPGENLAQLAAAGIHARSLQHRLAHAYADAPVEQKLPIRQRVAVIVGATSALWMLIGLGIYQAL
jgi:hypothetical protein